MNKFRLTLDIRRADGMAYPSREITTQAEEQVDEFVLDGWLHLERMDDDEWHLQVGDARISITAHAGRQPDVLVERGEYGPTRGQTIVMHGSGRPDFVAQRLVRHWKAAMAVASAQTVPELRVRVDGLAETQVVRDAYLSGASGSEEAMLAFASGLFARAIQCSIDDSAAPTSKEDPSP